MANRCAIGMTLTLEHEETARRLYDYLEKAKENGNLDFHGDVVFCNADITLNPKFCEVEINTDVRWALDCDDMIRFAKWLGQFVPVTELTASVNYEEPGCCIFGKYTLNNGILEDHYLEEKDLPESPDYDDDEAYSAYYDEIYARIDDKEGKLIYDFNRDEKPDLVADDYLYHIFVFDQVTGETLEDADGFGRGFKSEGEAQDYCDKRNDACAHSGIAFYNDRYYVVQKGNETIDPNKIILGE